MLKTATTVNILKMSDVLALYIYLLLPYKATVTDLKNAKY